MSEKRPTAIAYNVKVLSEALQSEANDDEILTNVSQSLEESIKSPRSAELQASLTDVFKRLTSRSEPEKLKAKFEELKSKRPFDFKPFLLFLAEVSEDEELLATLRRHAVARASRSAENIIDMPGSSPIVLQRKALFEDGATSAVLTSTVVRQKVYHQQQFKRHVLKVDEPDWLRTRDYLSLSKSTWQHAPEASLSGIGSRLPVASSFHFPNLALKSPLEQEEIAIRDLLFVMQGIESENISLNLPGGVSNDVALSVNPSFDPAIRELCSRILPMAANFHVVARFIEERTSFTHGQISQALCGRIRTFLKEYLVFLTFLERQYKQGGLTLQTFWFHAQSLLHSMAILASVCSSILTANLYGGATLSFLHAKVSDYLGDPVAQELCVSLVDAASKPFFEMLQKWLHKGTVDDPFLEFMVGRVENATDETRNSMRRRGRDVICEAELFDKQYVLRRDYVPAFLCTVTEKILDCGKYVNVISLCGKAGVYKRAKRRPPVLSYEFEGRRCQEAIEQTYAQMSEQVVRLLVADYDLLGRLRSLKRYFFIDHGDFLLQFMETAEDELKKMIEDIVPHRIESLVDLALRTSSAASDPYKDDLRIKFARNSLSAFLLHVLRIGRKEITSRPELTPGLLDDVESSRGERLSSFEAFSFSYKLEWPLTLVFTTKAMMNYEMIFRQLFLCKFIERQLARSWLDSRTASIRALLLRHHIMSFVQNYLSYATTEVIEPAWHVLIGKLKKVTSLSDLVQLHSQFLDDCLKDCMLTSEELVATVDAMLRLAASFSAQWLKLSDSECEDMRVKFDDLAAKLTESVQVLSSVEHEKSFLGMLYRLCVPNF